MDELVAIICRKINEVLTGIGYAKLSARQRRTGTYCLKNQETAYQVLCRPSLTASLVQQLLALEPQADRLLVTRYVSPADGELLRKHRIQYADTAGNLFLHDKARLILISHCTKPPQLEQRKTSGRAWTSAGIKLIFLLLTEPDALNWVYRKLAEYSGVSLGSVRYIMGDLLATGMILDLQGKLTWRNREQVLCKWSDRYIDRLYNSISRTHYSGALPENTADHPLLLSGESAEICRGLLKSSRLLAYRTGNLNPYCIRNHWRVDPAGSIEVREPFWPDVRKFLQLPPLLVYADLLAEDDPRCREAAQEIFDRYLKGTPHGSTD